MLQGVGTSSKWTEETVEASGLMAPGARESRGWAGILQGTLVLGGAEDGRLVGRTAVSSQTKGPRMGGNCWSRGRKVRLLLGCAQVECRPSWLLRSRCTQCWCFRRQRQSVLRRIAVMGAADRVLWWRACLCGHGRTPPCERVVRTAFLAEFFDDLHWKSLLGR